MEYYDFKVFTQVLWGFKTKICTIGTYILVVPRVNRGKKCITWVDTPKSWHKVCLIFGRVGIGKNKRVRSVEDS